MSTFQRLHRKGQFMLGPPSFSSAHGWNTLQIDADLLLAVHPDVPLSHTKKGHTSLTCLGNLLDPRAPENTNSDILNRLCDQVSQSGQLDDLLRLTDGLFGRWAIIAACGSDAILMHDAAGQRQVHYVRHEGKMYCTRRRAQSRNVWVLHRPGGDPMAGAYAGPSRRGVPPPVLVAGEPEHVRGSPAVASQPRPQAAHRGGVPLLRPGKP